MMRATTNRSLVLGLLGLILGGGNAQAAPCHNNLPASNADSVYTDHGNGTVTDTRTGLMWKRCTEGLSGHGCQIGSAQFFDWAGALAHAEASTFANHTDWRLPNVKELASLVEECRWSPAINTNHFPNTPSSSFWSSSPYASASVGTWSVDFIMGGVGSGGFRGHNFNHVRLVRGGQ